eukprot:m.274943 g.274943  ORF g.274943 m.274943 type:complete len:394 (-) comp115617_c0_seq1:185-1366(-)
MDPSLFIAGVDENFFCGICKLVLCKPQTCSQGHPFCSDCLKLWLSSNRTCPECRDPMVIDRPIRCLVVEKMINKLSVRCPNVCKAWTGPVDSLEKHRETCGFEEIVCTHEGCNSKIQRQNLQQHKDLHRVIVCRHCHTSCESLKLNDHLEICDKVKVACANGCGVSGTREIVETHTADECPLTLVCCTHSIHGCLAKIPRKDLALHEQEDALKHVQLLTTKFEELRILSCLADPYTAKVHWKVQDFASIFEARKSVSSERFVKLGGFLRGLRVYHMGLLVQFNGDHVGIFIRPDPSGCCEMPLRIEGLTITLKAKPTSDNEDFSCTLVGQQESIDRVHCAMGWPKFLPLIQLTSDFMMDDGTIEIEAEIKIQPPTLPTKSDLLSLPAPRVIYL